VKRSNGRENCRTSGPRIPTPSGSAIVTFSGHSEIPQPHVFTFAQGLGMQPVILARWPIYKQALKRSSNWQQAAMAGSPVASHAALCLLLLLLQPAAAWVDQPHRHLAAAISVDWICAGVPSHTHLSSGGRDVGCSARHTAWKRDLVSQ
jgi:hypothetical protein